MLYLDYNATIRDIFNQVEEISQHGLDELYDDDVKDGRRSYAEAIIAAGLVSKEDLINSIKLLDDKLSKRQIKLDPKGRFLSRLYDQRFHIHLHQNIRIGYAILTLGKIGLLTYRQK